MLVGNASRCFRHDKLFQHGLVGTTRTSAPTSKCFQYLRKIIFGHFYGYLFRGDIWQGVPASYGIAGPYVRTLYMYIVANLCPCLGCAVGYHSKKYKPLSNHTHAIFLIKHLPYLCLILSPLCESGLYRGLHFQCIFD
jgi:hypothetical protein